MSDDDIMFEITAAKAPLGDVAVKTRILNPDGSITKVSFTAPSTLAARYGLTAAMATRLAGIDALTDIVVNA